MIRYLTPPLVGGLYAFLYTWWFGALAGGLSAFVIFALHVITYPITLETKAQAKDRAQLLRDVASLILVTSFFGAALAGWLIK